MGDAEYLVEKEDISYWIEHGWYILISNNHNNGMNCSSCNEHNEYANANQEDGPFKCWKCKKVWSLENRKIVKEDNIYFADGQEKAK